MAMSSREELLAAVQFNADGLVPAIAQQQGSGEVLMMAWMNRESLEMTLDSGRATYFSRSRARLWTKGEESGNAQMVLKIATDCDGDTLLLEVDQTGPACHTGTRTCFDTTIIEVTP
ncbi:MAG: phosphoribosyl-AMP cyclohydrolase [Actinomycetota bacterium]|nr:phosphoribosyl-AMP cyclohydrolase [Actinomycetota bacterium]